MQVIKQAARRPGSVLSLENSRGWVTTLRQLGLDDKGVMQGLTGSPIILSYSAGGREEVNTEVLRVLQEAGLRPSQAYHDMGRERFPTTNSLEEAIVVCQERWDYEWKAKFDERLLMMQAEWKVSGIDGLPTVEIRCGRRNNEERLSCACNAQGCTWVARLPTI
eukprot:gene926-5187_t